MWHVYCIINCFVYVHDHRLSHLSPDVHIIGHLNGEQYVCLCTKWIERVMKQSVDLFLAPPGISRSKICIMIPLRLEFCWTKKGLKTTIRSPRQVWPGWTTWPSRCPQGQSSTKTSEDPQDRQMANGGRIRMRWVEGLEKSGMLFRRYVEYTYLYIYMSRYRVICFFSQAFYSFFNLFFFPWRYLQCFFTPRPFSERKVVMLTEPSCPVTDFGEFSGVKSLVCPSYRCRMLKVSWCQRYLRELRSSW